jgi:DNA mismatch endonuclease (patch repair protein)
VAKSKSKRTKEEQRRYNMSRVRSNNTKIEVVLRKALWHEGIRYRKNYKLLPGKPDIAITKYRIAIFCDGEFWHGKDWGNKKDRLQSNRDYWIPKIERNMGRDYDVERQLRGMGWVVVRFWGEEIEKNLTDCVQGVKEMIFQLKMDSYDIDGQDLANYINDAFDGIRNTDFKEGGANG